MTSRLKIVSECGKTKVNETTKDDTRVYFFDTLCVIFESRNGSAVPVRNLNESIFGRPFYSLLSKLTKKCIVFGEDLWLGLQSTLRLMEKYKPAFRSETAGHSIPVRKQNHFHLWVKVVS